MSVDIGNLADEVLYRLTDGIGEDCPLEVVESAYSTEANTAWARVVLRERVFRVLVVPDLDP